MLVLGIETSCDDTALAIYCSEKGLLGELIGSQAAIHQPFGGVVPELASRDHLRQILPLLKQLLVETRLSISDLTGIAYTAGPGLLGAVMVGAAFARSLALALAIPSIAIHHIEGHLLVPMLDLPTLAPPFIALIVSGGHTLLVQVSALGCYQILGRSLDDAAGEAFDKTAKLLGLNYPGGPQIEKLARQGQPTYSFPRPMVNRPGLDFSFSGLKTHVANTWQASDQTEQVKADIALGLQTAISQTLLIKAKRALEATGVKRLVVVGGVSANQAIRQAFSTALPEDCQAYFPSVIHSTDNAAMIAFAGEKRLMAGQRDSDWQIQARARWSLEDLIPIEAAR